MRNRQMQRLYAEFPVVPDFRSLVNRTVLCLSLINSFRKWRYYPRVDANLNVFNSLRVLSWLWITLFSTFWYAQQVPSLHNVGTRRASVLYAPVEKEVVGTFAISTFLVISGFLTMHRLVAADAAAQRSPSAVVRARSRRWWQRVRLSAVWYARFVGARYVQLLPVSFAVFFIVPSALAGLGDGPFWQLFRDAPVLQGNCRRVWWANLLLINNIVPLTEAERCFPWAYFVALDFQLVAFAPLVHMLFKNLRDRWFAAVVLVMCVLSLALRYVAQRCEPLLLYDPRAASYLSLQLSAVHWYPHLMATPFLAGSSLYLAFAGVQHRCALLKMFGPDLFLMIHRLPMVVGVEDRASYWLLKRLQSQRFRMTSTWLGFVLLVACIVSSWVVHRDEVFGAPRTQWAQLFTVVVLLPWCAGLSLLTLPLLFGYGGIFRSFLIHRMWCGPSRLVLVAYLMCPVVMGYANARSYQPQTMQFTLFLAQWLGYSVLIFIVAFLFHMFIERPCLNLSSKGDF